MTLHAYANLSQIPVLVLSPSLEPLPLISASKFAISLDAGPKFRPTHVRLEGDDPIALSVLLDLDESDAQLMPDIDDVVAALSPNFLRRGDLSSLRGRRVILALTDGHDRGSSNTWNELRRFAAAGAVAIFGMTPHELLPSPEDVFDLLCGLTGGVVLATDARKIPRDLERFTDMLRDRYILEFPRTENVPPGLHGIEVTIGSSNAVIRPTGISVPITDPRILADPTTVPTDPSRAPELGKRRILTPE